MPRRRATQSGAPAQAIGPTPGQEYGMGVQQMELQRAMPAPALNQGVSPNAGFTQPAPTTGQSNQALTAAPSAGDPFEAAMTAAAGWDVGPGALTMPTNRPGEPVTAGLSRGPGAGPEALAMHHRNPTGSTLERLTAATGDPMFARLAREAGL